MGMHALHKLSGLHEQRAMSILYFPRPSQKTNLLVLFYFNSQISITCFGLRPGHMVSDVLLTKINGNTKRLAYKIHFLWQLHFHFLPKRSSSVFTKLVKFKNVHPSGVSSSPLPPDMLLLSSLLPLVIISSATKICCHRPRSQGQFGFAPIASAPPSEAPRGTKVPSSLVLSKHFFILAQCISTL